MIKVTGNLTNTFKALYKPNNYNFSEKQQIIIADIENKLSSRISNNDYCVTPHGKNAVSLYKVSKPKVSSLNPNNITFDKTSFYASFDEKHPFDVKKLDDAEKFLKQMESFLKALIYAVIPLTVSFLVLMGVMASRVSKDVTKMQTELIQKCDTLKNSLVK